jgi:hypothetical protein
MADTERARALAALLPVSREGRGGELIPEHRAFRTLTFSRSKLAVVLLLPVAFNAVTWLMLRPITAGWRTFFSFWIERLAIEGKASFIPRGPQVVAIPVPYVELPTRMPDALTWWATLGLTVLALLAAPSIPERWLPVRYLLRVVVFIQLTAVAFFATVPAAFPYSLPQYIVSSLQTAVWFMLVLPWVHALVYYIFDFSLAQKVRLTGLTLLFVATALPFQLMVHAYLLLKGSMLLMPALYLVFGIWLLIFPCVGLYGWAMSWPHVRSEQGRDARSAAPGRHVRGGVAEIDAAAPRIPARAP